MDHELDMEMDPKLQSEYLQIIQNAENAMADLSAILNADLQTGRFDELHSLLVESIHTLQHKLRKAKNQEIQLNVELNRLCEERDCFASSLQQ